MCSVLCKLLGRRFDIGVDLLLFRGNAPVLEEIIEGSLSLGVRDFLINSFLAIGRGAKHKCMEPTGEDYAKLAKLIAKFKDEASFKVSGRLASKMKAQFSFIPFENGERGRIIAITADKKVKPSSLMEEAYSFERPEEVSVCYRKFIAP